MIKRSDASGGCHRQILLYPVLLDLKYAVRAIFQRRWIVQANIAELNLRHGLLLETGRIVSLAVGTKVIKELNSNAILNKQRKAGRMLNVEHLSVTELERGMDHIRQSPKDNGVLKLIARRPDIDEREVINEGQLNLTEGLEGDTWKARGSSHTTDGSANVNAQITVMNARAIALLAQDEERWSLAGDQLYIDMDLSDENIPPGTRLGIGTAIIEVSAQPHSGCKKFSSRFGVEAMKFVNSPEGKRLHLRGINTKVVQAGTIRVGDVIKKL